MGFWDFGKARQGGARRGGGAARCQIVIYMDFVQIPNELNWKPEQSYR